MGWYLRKSFSAGPLRFNLSKSGIGTSFGVRGARVSLGPRGAYLNAGGGGLYFRQSLNGPRLSNAFHAGGQSSQVITGSGGAFFNNAQIYRPKMALDLRLKDKSWSGIFLFLSLLLGGASLFLSDYPIWQKGFAWSCAGSALIALILKLDFWLIKFTSFLSYHSAKTKILKQTINYDLQAVQKIALKKKASSRNYALCRLFVDVLARVLNDAKLDVQESIFLVELEKTLDDTNLSKTIKRYAFHQAYLVVVADNVLTHEEEDEISKMQHFLRLSDDDVVDEISTLQKLKEVRKAQEGKLEPISPSISMQKDEICYHQTHGREAKEKIVQSYQQNGVRHKVTDWVVESEGDIYLTSKRIIVVADGVKSIRLDKIFDIETDIDKNALNLSVDGRKSLLTLTVPDSIVVSAKLNHLIEEARSH
ncbi:MAG: DUF4236 domain-containing protein [Candidatus Omnitrophica bacterium]|nr:DUF4236 domain-containing protein [Candidatus Omnitrophota bacterium]